MNNKMLSGGIIALAILVLITVSCSWFGKKIKEGFGGTDDAGVNNQEESQMQSLPPITEEEAERVFLALGNPSAASAADPNNYLLINNFFAVSYNREKAIPNWVAWRISPAETGKFPRPNPDPFRPDARVPKSWKPVTPSDYTGSGFDKGHLCPSADRSSSVEAMTATFLMTNMTPQTPDLNRGPWQKLEAYLRTLVTRGNDVYIVAGVYGEKGKLKNKVSVPTNDWKIAVAVPGNSNISAINEDTRVIAVDMPNVNGIKNSDWQAYRTTVRTIEQRTGYNLLANLPQDLQDVLENKTDNINN